MIFKSRERVKEVLFGVFVGMVFIAMLIVFSIVNYLGAYMQTVGCILVTAVAVTAFFCTEYLLLRAIYCRLRKKSSDKSIGDELYEMFNTK